jgi:hypothetical protein
MVVRRTAAAMGYMCITLVWPILSTSRGHHTLVRPENRG